MHVYICIGVNPRGIGATTQMGSWRVEGSSWNIIISYSVQEYEEHFPKAETFQK